MGLGWVGLVGMVVVAVVVVVGGWEGGRLWAMLRLGFGNERTSD